MKKYKPGFLLFMMVSIFLIGCSNAADQNNNDDSNVRTLWENTEGSNSQKVNLKETEKDGIKTKALTYTLQENSTNRRVGFGILKIESNNNVVYKGVIMAGRKTGAFSSDFWTNYRISCGQSNITMANAVGSLDKEDDYYEYIVMGGISENQLNTLKNANVLSISLQNPNNSERNTQFICDPNFIINLIRYF